MDGARGSKRQREGGEEIESSALRPGRDSSSSSFSSPSIFLPIATAPSFQWSGGSRSQLSAQQAARGVSIHLPPMAVSGSISAASLFALRSTLALASTVSAPCALSLSCRSVERAAWLPPALAGTSVNLVFPGVGFGNRMFLYSLARTSALVLGREFRLLTPHPLFSGVETIVAPLSAEIYDSGDGLLYVRQRQNAATASFGVEVAASGAAAGATAANTTLLPLPLFLSLAARAGGAWITAQPSCGAAGSLIREAAPLVAAWFSPLVVRCLCASLRAARDVGAGVDDWVVHVRAGDIWRTPGEPARGAINTAYCPPPLAWYTLHATRVGMRRAWLVCGAPDGELAQAVAGALRAGGCEDVRATRGDESADFGTLLRARNILLSCSTFAWWAAVLAPFRPAVYARTLSGIAARESASAEAAIEASAAAAEAISKGRQIRICVPETGMLRAASIHAIHADLSLASHAPRAWFDATALNLENTLTGGAQTLSASVHVEYFRVWSDAEATAMDAYTCTPAQRARILEARIPEGAEGGRKV